MPELEELVRSAEDISQKEIVLLAISSIDGDGFTNRETLRDHIRRSKVAVPPEYVSTYLARLEEAGLVYSPEEGSVELTVTGEQAIEDLIGVDGRGELSPFLRGLPTDRDFYKGLMTNLDICYKGGAYSAFAVMFRKLHENLLIDILRAHYGTEDMRLYYDPNTAQFHGLGTLIENLGENLNEFQPYSREMGEELIENIEQIKHTGDAAAHSIEVNLTEQDIERLVDLVPEVTEVLFRTLERIERAG